MDPSAPHPTPAREKCTRGSRARRLIPLTTGELWVSTLRSTKLRLSENDVPKTGYWELVSLTLGPLQKPKKCPAEAGQ
jgi:hypothetical protein